MYDNGSVGFGTAGLAATGLAFSTNLGMGLAVVAAVAGILLLALSRRHVVAREY